MLRRATRKLSRLRIESGKKITRIRHRTPMQRRVLPGGHYWLFFFFFPSHVFVFRSTYTQSSIQSWRQNAKDREEAIPAFISTSQLSSRQVLH